MFILRFLVGVAASIITRIVVLLIAGLILYYVLNHVECDFLQ